jgi:uncharacterized protein with von Willebrand factor type A (vWA) domain
MAKVFEGAAEFKALVRATEQATATLAEFKAGSDEWQRMAEAAAAAAAKKAEEDARARIKLIEAEQGVAEKGNAATGAADNEDGEDEVNRDSNGDNDDDNDDNDDDDDDDDDNDEARAAATTPRMRIRVPPMVLMGSPKRRRGRRELRTTLDAQVSTGGG